MHRDLKPDNILMHNPIGTTEVHMKISDFGLSRVLDDTLLAKTHCGTPLHMAPEVLLETGGFSVKADIWSVGVIMYQLLTKKHPFMSQTLQELMQKVRATPARPNNITDNCWNFIQGLLTFNAKDRLSAKQALRHAFFQPIRESALREEERHSVGINRSIVPLTATQIAHDAGRVNSQFNPAPLPEQDNVQDPLMSMSLVEMNEIMAKATQSLSYTPPLRRAIIDQLLKE
ncbi:MAG: putative CBN-UNC-51 protein, partial [Streblomastix strix]